MDIQIIMSLLLSEMRQFRRRDHWNRQQLTSYQSNALHSLREYAISGWQVIQEVDGLRVLLSGIHSAFKDEMLADTLRQALREQGANIAHVEVQRVVTIPKTAAGKSPLIKSNIQH